MIRSELAALTVGAAAIFAAACTEPTTQSVDVEVIEDDAAVVESVETVDVDAGPGAVRAQDMARRIAALSSDEFEGRAPASPGGVAASQWIADEMAAIGLAPAADGSYFQPVPLVESTLDAGASSLELTASGEALGLEYGENIVYWTQRTDDAVTVESSDLVFVGYGVVAPEYGWDDYAGVDVTGRTVVMLINDPGFATEDPELFNGRAMTYYGRWTYKFEEAARQGAAGAIIVHQTAPASYGWDVVSGSWSGSQFALHQDADAALVGVEAWVSESAGRELFERAGLSFDELSQAAQQRGFQAVALDGLSLSANLQTSVRELDSRNVAGVLPGSERPDEYVLYMAHWDHLGVREAAEGEDGIYNGAVDNATGTAAILEIAERFASLEQRPARSALFVAVTAEESGLLGSAYFAENPLAPLANIVAGVNIDAMLPVGRTRDIIVVGFGASELEDLLAEEAAGQDRILRPDPNPEAGYFYRSDHASLAKVGVPMLYADGGEDHREFGSEFGAQIQTDYRTNDYHAPSDEFSEDWDMSGMEEDVQLLFQLGHRLATSSDWPNWYAGNEFRALRDAQRAGAD